MDFSDQTHVIVVFDGHFFGWTLCIVVLDGSKGLYICSELDRLYICEHVEI